MKRKENITDQNNNTQSCCKGNGKWAWTKYRACAWIRWAFLFIALLLIGLFIIGYLFDPSVTRILWLSFSGALLVIVLPVFLFAGKWIRQCEDTCEVERNVEQKPDSYE